MLLYTYKMNKNRKSSDFYKCIVLENQDFIPASIKKQNQFSWPFSTVVYMLKKDLYSLIPICSTVFLFRNIYWKITLFQELWQVTRQPLSLSSYASIYPSCSSQKPVGHSRFSFSLSPATIKLTNFYRLHDCCFFFFFQYPLVQDPTISCLALFPECHDYTSCHQSFSPSPNSTYPPHQDRCQSSALNASTFHLAFKKAQGNPLIIWPLTYFLIIKYHFCLVTYYAELLKTIHSFPGYSSL